MKTPIRRGLIGTLAAAALTALRVWAAPADIAQKPLIVELNVTPRVLFVISKDHALYYKAYTDWNDLNGDGTPDSSYVNSFTYYGYFDSAKCYDYSTSNARFEPKALAANHYCDTVAGAWSGNFLNWASMSRMDVLRKVLYGGYRSTDTASTTVLERAFLPTDAHSFAKFYQGTDIAKLTPFAPTCSGSGCTPSLTLCNTTYTQSGATGYGTGQSQTVTTAPRISVAKGDFRYWAANERWQCTWDNEQGDNASGPSTSDPSRTTDGLGDKDYLARVQVCVADASLRGDEECKRYPSGNFKPVGLLHNYGENGQLLFGLLTGSYAKNKSGGVLRKNVADFKDEVNTTTDGTFTNTAGFVKTLNTLRIARYDYSDGTYVTADSCNYRLASFNDGACSNWGNPLSEMYLEGLRYFAGLTANSAYAATDSNYIAGLATATWKDPLLKVGETSVYESCANCNVIMINASEPSYDHDGTDLENRLDGFPSAAARTDTVADAEAITGHYYFVGENGTDVSPPAASAQLCTAKQITSLGRVRGACPGAPRLSGTYLIAGLAHWAHTNDIRANLAGTQNVTTRAITLLPAAPKLVIPVPGHAPQTVSILPACRNLNLNPSSPPYGNCAIVDFKIIQQDIAAGTGTVYVNWENGEQGGDYDQDMKGTLRYTLATAGRITVTTDTDQQSADGVKMGFGYVIGGTYLQDGFHAHSGANAFAYSDPTGALGCVNCQVADAPTSYTYTLGTSSASLLQEPLWYAAKYGSFTDTNSNKRPDGTSEWDSDDNGFPDGYFFANDPAQIGPSLQRFLDTISATSSSASVAANAITLNTSTRIYQSRYDSKNWSGDLLAFPLNPDGSIRAAAWSAKVKVESQAASGARRIITSNATTHVGVPFRWDADNTGRLDTNQQDALRRTCSTCTLEAVAKGQGRVAWLRGDRSTEVGSGGALRTREFILGDLVNSEPCYVGAPSSLYPDSLETTNYQTFVTAQANRRHLIYVGGNDGMLHAFAAIDGSEVFGYVPRAVYAKLALLGEPGYKTEAADQHQYYVDAGPQAADAFITPAGAATAQWRTILVGGLGAGGAGMFALDITDPAGFADESAASGKVLWDITGDDTGFSNLGFTFSKPAIVKLPNLGGTWAAAFGNGYEGETDASLPDKASLYIVDAATGQLLYEVVADATGPNNGLSSVAPVDYNGDMIVDFIYAGDLEGNLWRFEPDGASAWKVSFGGLPLYRGTAPTTPTTTPPTAPLPAPPITVRPEVVRGPNGTGVMVLFGTGSYYLTADKTPRVKPINAFFGIWDRFDGTADIRIAHLLQQTIMAETQQQNFTVRVTSANVPTWHTGTGLPTGSPPTTHLGWYLPLVYPAVSDPVNAVGQGELQVTEPQVRGGRIIFTTTIPSTVTCDLGGDGWLMELNALDGQRPASVVFDLNSDGVFNSLDMATVTENGATVQRVCSGKKSEVGIIQEPAIISAGIREFKYASGAKEAKIESTAESTPSAGMGRSSWLQLH